MPKVGPWYYGRPRCFPRDTRSKYQQQAAVTGCFAKDVEPQYVQIPTVETDALDSIPADGSRLVRIVGTIMAQRQVSG